MRLIETLAAASATVILAGGVSGCSAENTSNIGCGKYAVKKDVTVQSLARAIQLCRQNLPGEFREYADGGNKIGVRIPTKEGNNTWFTAMSDAPESAGPEAYAAQATFVSVSTTYASPAKNDKGSTLSAATQSRGIYTQWVSKAPSYQKVTAGGEPGFAKPVVTVQGDLPPLPVADRINPKLVECVQNDTLKQFAQALGSASTSADLPTFTLPPLTAPCNKT